MKKTVIISLLLLAAPVALLAAPREECGDAKKECAACHSLSINDAKTLLKDVGEVKSVKMAPVEGLYELTLENKGQRGTAYMDFKRKHLIAGTIFDIATKKVIGEKSSVQPMKIDVATVPLANSVVMGNSQGKKKLFVFTDPECPYCRKLHHELVKLMYMEPDLTIYIKLYPLKMHPQSYDKARVILSADNSLYMLDKAFAGETMPPPGPKDPAKPVDETMKFAESIGITATPTLVLPDGRILPGFREAGDLKNLLGDGR